MLTGHQRLRVDKSITEILMQSSVQKKDTC